MKTRCYAALFLGLLAVCCRADETGTANAGSESLWITSIAPSTDDSFVVGTATGLLLRPGTVARFQADAPGELETLYEHPVAVWTVATTSDGKTIASADYKGNLVTYDLASKQATTHENAFERWCQKIVVSPDDQSIVAGNESGKLFAWSIADAKVSKAVELGKASITSIAFSPANNQLAATDGDGKVHLLKWPELESLGVISIGEETAWCVAYESESSLIVGSEDRNLYRVEAKPDAKPQSIAKGSDWITRIAVSKDGQIAASEVSGKIHFASGGSVSTIGAESGVWALCFRGSGQLLVGTRKNGIVLAGQSWAWKPIAPKVVAKEQEETPAAAPAEEKAAEEKAAEEKAAEEKAAPAEAKPAEEAK
ncbi:MAG: WD40 repeat domain-containing protein [Planctomycetales bacterium]|nr:WD40 repeat domain-containing protein [Planctomycetales bacterium]